MNGTTTPPPQSRPTLELCLAVRGPWLHLEATVEGLAWAGSIRMPDWLKDDPEVLERWLELDPSQVLAEVYHQLLQKLPPACLPSGLSLHLTLDGSSEVDLRVVPWERLGRPVEDLPVRHRGWSVVRRWGASPPGVAPGPPPGELGLLFIGHSPEDSPLDHHRELVAIRGAGVKVRVLWSPSLLELCEAIREFSPQVVHFSAHGVDESRAGKEAGGKSYRVAAHLARRGLLLGAPDQPVVFADELLEALLAARVPLVVMAACESARRVSAGPFSDLASELFAHGVPAVVGFSRAFEDRWAPAFVRSFYGSLIGGDTVERALDWGRAALAAVDRRASDGAGIAWWLPVLYSATPEMSVGARRQAPEDEQRILGEWCRWIVEKHQVIELLHMESGGTLPLDGVYSNLQALREKRGQFGTFEAPSADTLPCGPAAMLGHGARLVVLGDPGAGKSTFCRWLARRLARAWLGEETPLAGILRLPVLLPASAWPKGNLGAAIRTLAAACADERQSGASWGEALAELLLAALGRGEVFLLVDGLDELGDQKSRLDLIVRLQGALGAEAPGAGGALTRLLLTSRLVGYEEASFVGAEHFRLLPLDPSAAAQFCQAYLGAVGRPDEAAALVEAVATLRAGGGEALTGNPWTLSLLVLIFFHDHQLPAQRHAVYSRVMRAMIQRLTPAGTPDREAEQAALETTLQALAWQLQVGEPGALIRTEDLERWERKLGLASSGRRPWRGLLSEKGPGRYGFVHAGLREFLAATMLAAEALRAPEEAAWRAKWREHYAEPRWREPLVLAVGILGETEAGRFPLVQLVQRTESDLDLAFPWGALLVVEALGELREPGPLLEGVVGRLVRARAHLVRASARVERIVDAGAGAAAPLRRALVRVLKEAPAGVALRRALAGTDAPGAAPAIAQAGAAALAADLLEGEAASGPLRAPLLALMEVLPTRELPGDHPAAEVIERLREHLLARGAPGAAAWIAEVAPGLPEWLTQHPFGQRLGRLVYAAAPWAALVRRQEVLRLRETTDGAAWQALTDELREIEKQLIALDPGDIALDAPAVTTVLAAHPTRDRPGLRAALLHAVAEPGLDRGDRTDLALALAALGEDVRRYADQVDGAQVRRRWVQLKPVLRALVLTELQEGIKLRGQPNPGLLTVWLRCDPGGASFDLSGMAAGRFGQSGVALALAWLSWINDPNGFDGYNVAVQLDTQGHLLASDPARLLAGFVIVGNLAHFADPLAWPFQVVTGPTDAPIDANTDPTSRSLSVVLDVLEALPAAVDFVAEWALFLLFPRFDAAGFGEELRLFARLMLGVNLPPLTTVVTVDAEAAAWHRFRCERVRARAGLPNRLVHAAAALAPGSRRTWAWASIPSLLLSAGAQVGGAKRRHRRQADGLIHQALGELSAGASVTLPQLWPWLAAEDRGDAMAALAEHLAARLFPGGARATIYKNSQIALDLDRLRAALPAFPAWREALETALQARRIFYPTARYSEEFASSWELHKLQTAATVSTHSAADLDFPFRFLFARAEAGLDGLLLAGVLQRWSTLQSQNELRARWAVLCAHHPVIPASRLGPRGLRLLARCQASPRRRVFVRGSQGLCPRYAPAGAQPGPRTPGVRRPMPIADRLQFLWISERLRWLDPDPVRTASPAVLWLIAVADTVSEAVCAALVARVLRGGVGAVTALRVLLLLAGRDPHLARPHLDRAFEQAPRDLLAGRYRYLVDPGRVVVELTELGPEWGPRHTARLARRRRSLADLARLPAEERALTLSRLSRQRTIPGYWEHIHSAVERASEGQAAARVPALVAWLGIPLGTVSEALGELMISVLAALAGSYPDLVRAALQAAEASVIQRLVATSASSSCVSRADAVSLLALRGCLSPALLPLVLAIGGDVGLVQSTWRRVLPQFVRIEADPGSTEPPLPRLLQSLGRCRPEAGLPLLEVLGSVLLRPETPPARVREASRTLEGLALRASTEAVWALEFDKNGRTTRRCVGDWRQLLLNQLQLLLGVREGAHG